MASIKIKLYVRPGVNWFLSDFVENHSKEYSLVPLYPELFI